jgi:hypothetical protein
MQRRRENTVFNDLINALAWGKTEAYLRESGSTLVNYLDWQEGSEPRASLSAMLSDEIAAVIRVENPHPARIAIDKEGLDRWILWISEANEPSPLREPNPPTWGRPAFRWGAIRAEL